MANPVSVPEGHLIVARRFIAGYPVNGTTRPVGTNELGLRANTFKRPYGTPLPLTLDPAINRRATIKSP